MSKTQISGSGGAKAESEVSRELGMLHKQIDNLNRLQDDLIGKLAPILTEVQPVDAKDQPTDQACSCPIGTEIQNARQKVEDIISMTNECFQQISV